MSIEIRENTGFVFVLILFQFPISSSMHSPPMYAQSISDMQELERFEFQVVKNLTFEFLATEKLPLGSSIRHLVNEYLMDFYESSGYTETSDFITKEETRVSESLICSYRLIRRVAYLLRELVLQEEFSHLLGSLSREIVDFFLPNRWPKMDDLEILAEKILRIQLVYDLDAEQLANGWMSTVPSNCTLNSMNCYEIANVATKTDQFSSAIQWLEVAKEKALVDNVSSSALIEASLWNAIENHNTEFDEEIMLELEPSFFDRKISHVPNDSKSAGKLRNLQYNAFKGMKEKPYENVNYWGLCSGDSFQTESEKSVLFCWYEFKVHPTFTIGPVKTEFLTRNPDIVQMYDVIYENEIQTVVTECGPEMIPSPFSNAEYQFGQAKRLSKRAYVIHHRSSVQSFCMPSIAKKLERKTEILTGMIAVGHIASEPLQALSYSVGGHILPHMDEISSLADKHTVDDIRIATVIYYFNQVDNGGETTFVAKGVSAKPIKGSAVLWFDVFSDGNADWMTNHASCPILFGDKWSANKWVKYGSQFSTRKCGLKRMERYQVPVNNVYLPLPSLHKK